MSHPTITPAYVSPPAGPSSGLRLMAVHAHPDDEASKGAATIARLVSEGAEVLVVTCTGGEAGSILNEGLRDREEELMADLPAVRRAEMAEAARILGIQHAWLGFSDSGWPEEDEQGNRPPVAADTFAGLALETVTEPLVALIRSFQPHVITTYDEKGGYPHPDHIRTHEVTMAAVAAASDAQAFPGTGQPWTVSKVYYHLTFDRARILAMHEACVANDIESPYEEMLERLEAWMDGPEVPPRLTTSVECADFFPVRDDALRAHATQIDPDTWWFLMPLELQKATWPTEDYQLAHTVFQWPEGIEDDLFAGVRERKEERAA